MTLRNHFRRPTDRTRLRSVCMMWATRLTARLNDGRLTERFIAEPNVLPSGGMETDADSPRDSFHPAPEFTIDATFPDELGVRIYDQTRGGELVGAIELVSESNKDTDESREAFVGKCVGLLRCGIGLMIVDIVTKRHANLHGEMLDLLGEPAGGVGRSASLYAASYRPRRLPGDPPREVIEVWLRELAVGQPLPTQPLGLKNGPVVPVELDLTYEESCHVFRIPQPAEGGDDAAG